MRTIAISEIVMVKLVAVSLLLFAMLWVLKFILRNAPFRRTVKAQINRILPILEGILWFGFMLWSIRQLLHDELWNSVGVLAFVLLVVVFLSWLVLRDYLAGIIIKSEGSMKLNDWIKVRDFEGKITRMAHRHMIITTESGESVTIPYSALSGEISSKPNPSDKLISHTFEIKISKKTDSESAIKLIRRAILNAPWASVKKPPEVRLLSDSLEYYHFEISLYSIKVLYFQKIKDQLEAVLTSLGFRYQQSPG